MLMAHSALHLRSESGQDWLARISLCDLRLLVVVAKRIGQVTYLCCESVCRMVFPL